MNILSKNERHACRVLCKLKHDGQEYYECLSNDLRMWYCEKILKVNVRELFKKVIENEKGGGA